mmetsp:Transcript_13373/g.48685  ORF Transcript_13373/g.48685 Transcript_13373/m.48685 type:complete len:571 (+) Transcript_13373:246-1958(+)
MWHEAKRHNQKVAEWAHRKKAQAERRAKRRANRRGNPLRGLRLVGVPCKPVNDKAQYEAQESGANLMPWNGRQDVMIDRFDGRALLDFIREYNPRVQWPPELTDEQIETAQLVNFYSYRNLVKFRVKKIREEDALKLVEEDIERRALTSRYATKQPAQEPQHVGVYSSVGYSYESGPPEEPEGDSDGDSDHDIGLSDLDSENEGMADVDPSEMDAIAEQFGIDDYCQLARERRRRIAEENEEKESDIRRASAFLSKRQRKDAMRQGIDIRDLHSHFEAQKPQAAGSPVGYITGSSSSRQRRHSPTYDSYGIGAQDNRRKDEPAKTEYITEFGGLKPGSSRPIHTAVNWTDVEASHTVVVPKDRLAPGGKVEVKPKGKETPQERLKRLMAMQLNKQAQKDTAAERQKRLRDEKERLDTMESMRAAQARAKDAPSPPPPSYERHSGRSMSRSRSRSRSRSPSTSTSRSRSRSRSRSLPRSRSWSRSPRRRSRSPLAGRSSSPRGSGREDRYARRDSNRRGFSRSRSPIDRRRRRYGSRSNSGSDSQGYRSPRRRRSGDRGRESRSRSVDGRR